MDTGKVVVIALSVVVVGFLVMLLYHDATTPTFKLYKDEWECSKAHTSLRPQSVGKTVILMQQRVCDEYVRLK